MKFKARIKAILYALLAVVFVTACVVSLYFYTAKQRKSLWRQLVMNVMEVTEQGGHSFEVYLNEKLEMVGRLEARLSNLNSDNRAEIESILASFLSENSIIFCAVFDEEKDILYFGDGNEPQEYYADDNKLGNEKDEKEAFEEFFANCTEKRGYNEPYCNLVNGLRTLGVYANFDFKDGKKGIVRLGQYTSALKNEFTLTFFDGAGFSYIVNSVGDVIIHPLQTNSNHTFLNVFELIGQDNSEEDMNTFIHSMKDGNIGAMQLEFGGTSQVFTFVPISANEGWYLISVIPDSTLNTHADSILNTMSVTAVILVIVFAVFIIIAVVFFVYRKKMKLHSEQQEQNRIVLEGALKLAKQASEAKTLFLSNMSHDIRTPMNAIVGMTTIAAKHMDDKKKVEDCLNKISLSGHHLLTLINDVLDISKIESGKIALNPVAVSLRNVMSNLVNIVRPLIKAKNQSFEVHIKGIDYETVIVDEVRLSQIFINILSNAVKYTQPDTGKIVLELFEELLPDGKSVRVTYIVQDNGMGMSEEFQKNMYEIFSRAEDSRTNKIQGSGLGLAIVKQMVTLMNGTIECESELDKGTKFTIKLDLPIGKSDTDDRKLPDVRILVVDDDEIFLETTRDTIEDLGAQIDTATTGEQALKLASENAYSVIIVDWRMPDMNGCDIAESIRKKVKKPTPIILASAYDWTEIEEKMHGKKIDGFISKPLFRSYIYEKLCEVLKIEAEKNPVHADGTNDLEGLHILVAEDNELNWEVISELLEMYNITAERAENGRLCIEKLTSEPEGTFDLILMDVQMPEMDGKSATKKIRKLENDYMRNIPIIAMTADAFAEDIASCIDAGMNGHTAKPVDMDVLFHEIQKILKK